MPPTALISPKPRPYRRFLTSALHTRFVHAAGISLLWSLMFAGVTGDWYSNLNAFFWAFFPIGPAGIKAGLFSITTLAIYFLQISYLELGKRTTQSKWRSTKIIFTSSATYITFLSYLASAWWFTEVFVFTSPRSSELSWVINGGYGAPDKVNERPIYLRTFFLLLALIHAALHTYFDECTVTVPVRSIIEFQGDQAHLNIDDQITATLMKKAPGMVIRAGLSSLSATALSPFAYTWVLRQPFWKIHLAFAKAFADIPRSEANPPSNFYIGTVMIKAFIFGTMLSMTWQFTVLFFSIYIASPPLKATKPLSAYSKDPNGTLLNGLVSKKDLVKTFAFWEFDIISREPLPTRRKDIFGDFERTDQPPLFTSMLNASLAVVKSIQTRIVELDPTAPSTAPLTNLQGGPLPPDPSIHQLPKLLPAAVPAKNTIFQVQPANLGDRTDRLGRYISDEARTIGSSENPWSPPVDRTVQLAVEYTAPALDEARNQLKLVQKSSFGQYFVSQPVRLIQSAILGIPNANAALITHALSGLSGFLVKSVEEDLYGKAVAGVPETVVTLTKTIFAIEKFVKTQTGGVLAQVDAKRLDEVMIVHQSLKACLREIMTPFQHFLIDVGLSIRELNEANNAAEERKLFETIAPAPKSTGSTRPAPPKSLTKEMEEVGNQKNPRSVASSRGHVQPSVEEDQDAEPRRRISRATKGKEIAEQEDQNRPGRLFSALDKGSAYSTMRENQRKQPSKTSKSQSNEGLTRRSSGKKNTSNSDNVNGHATGNVFGARDFNSLPAGGLDRRRTGEVR